MLELGAELVAGADRGVHARVEDGEAGLAVRLGHVHRDVGVAHELLRIAPASRALAMPMLALTVIGGSPMTYGTRRSRTRRSAMARRGAGPASSSVRIANSSPPSRATRSPSRTSRDPLGDRDEQRVARGVAERVVDDLEVVEVDEEHGRDPLRVRSLAPSVRSRVSWNIRRLAAPVSESRSARSCTCRSRTALRRLSAATAENWPETDATRRSMPKTVRERCSTTIAPTGRPSAIIGETRRLRASGISAARNGFASGLEAPDGNELRRSQALAMTASAGPVPRHSVRRRATPGPSGCPRPRRGPCRARSRIASRGRRGRPAPGGPGPRRRRAGRRRRRAPGGSARRWRSSRSFIAEKIDVASAKSQNDVTLRTGIRSKSTPRPGMTSTGGRSAAACAYRTTNSRSECHSATFSPVRYDASSDTATRWR